MASGPEAGLKWPVEAHNFSGNLGAWSCRHKPCYPQVGTPTLCTSSLHHPNTLSHIHPNTHSPSHTPQQLRMLSHTQYTRTVHHHTITHSHQPHSLTYTQKCPPHHSQTPVGGPGCRAVPGAPAGRDRQGWEGRHGAGRDPAGLGPLWQETAGCAQSQSCSNHSQGAWDATTHTATAPTPPAGMSSAPSQHTHSPAGSRAQSLCPVQLALLSTGHQCPGTNTVPVSKSEM